ncbi:MAG: DNA polymerase I [Endomicrobiia bacterium]
MILKQNSSKIFLIDGNAYIHRAYHALPPLTTFSGLPINAVYGFIRMLFKILKNFKPEYLCICFDSSKPTFRHQIYKEYKSTRKELEENLKIQFPLVHNFVKESNIPYLIIDGYEADDIICSLAKKFEEKYKIVIISGDKDILQLVNKNIIVYNELKDIWYDEEKVKQKYGVIPKLLVDYFVLIGDKTDNIPGVEGVGPKTASMLINKYGNIEEIIRNIEKIEFNKKDKILSAKEDLYKNKELLKLVSDIDYLKNFEIEEIKLYSLNFENIKNFLTKYDMKSILKELENLNFYSQHKPLVETSNLLENKQLNLFTINYNEKNKKLTDEKTVYINSYKSLQEVTTFLNNAKNLFFSLLIKNKIAKEKQIIGLIGIITTDKNEKIKFYFPKIIHKTLSGKTLSTLEDNSKFIHLIQTIFSLKTNIVTYDLKTQLSLLSDLEQKFLDYHNSNIFDLLIISYLLNPNKKISSLQEIFNIYMPGSDVSNFILPAEIDINNFPLEKITDRIFDTLKLTEMLFENYIYKDFIEYELLKIYQEIELPLISILIKMEKNGILVDKEYIKKIKVEIENELEDTKKQIKNMSEIEINLNSPKQLAFLLFEKLKLPPIKKKKTGYSTDEEVLLKLKDVHPVIQLILKHRELEKLKNTYIEPLSNYINLKTSRIHTTFNPIGTATGRLSSEEPNLQNIPVKTALGKKIRQMFISEEEYTLASFDYSQIELRILAHFSNEKNLSYAFFNNKDIHKSTACEVFGIKEEDVDDNFRRIAKIINFGIIYGITPQGLAKELNIPIEIAEEYIKKYFEKYPEVKKWIEETIKTAKTKGYVKTLFGRIRPIPEIKSPNKHLATFGERIAINTPIQGTSADIIKLAMIKIDEYIKKENLQNKIRMLLQIHDELIFEIHKSILENSVNKIKNIMENIVKLNVPLVVDVEISTRWKEI